VAATGRQNSVRQFVEAAASELGFDVVWKGKGAAERGIDRHTGKLLVALDPRYLRPTEVDTLLGDAAKARKELGWKPTVSFDQLVREMAREDLAIAEREALIKTTGYSTPRRSAD
jgi:GDPmannose 4,6-dehydratase